jgi:hypothetical protein
MIVLTGAVDLHYLIRSMKTDEDLQSACDDHEHSHRDQTLLACGEFFRRVILDGQVLVGEKEFPVPMNKGRSARAQRLRDGLIRVKGSIDAPAVDIPWNQSSMSHHDLNMMNKTSRFIAKLDYMMKLQAKQYKADTSIFHLMMSKGCSVHVFCFKGRIDDERLEEMTSNNAGRRLRLDLDRQFWN